MSSKERFCLVHYSGTDSSLLPFTKKRFQTFLSRRRQWLELVKDDDVSSLVAKKSLSVCPDENVNYTNFFFHAKCYNQFTDVSKIERAEERAAKRKEHDNPEQNPLDKDLRSPEAKRRTRSTFESVLQQKSCASNVLPHLCIICKQKNAYFKNKVSLGPA